MNSDIIQNSSAVKEMFIVPESAHDLADKLRSVASALLYATESANKVLCSIAEKIHPVTGSENLTVRELDSITKALSVAFNELQSVNKVTKSASKLIFNTIGNIDLAKEEIFNPKSVPRY